MGDEGHVTRGELSAYEDDLSLLTLDTSEEEIISSDSDMETDWCLKPLTHFNRCFY